MDVEKTPLSSKKFVAYLVAEVTWKLVLAAALFTFREQLSDASVWGWWFMITTVIIAGFVEVGFIGGQAWLDRYVRVAQLAAQQGGPHGPGSSDQPKTP